MLDNIRKWRKSRPKRQDGPKAFFNDLAVRLGCGPHVTGVMLVDADLDRFIDYLPEAKRESARSVAMYIPPEVLLSPGPEDSGLKIMQPVFKTTPLLPGLQSLLLHFKGPVESIAKGIKAGRIDQRHYYLTPDAADGWNKLVTAEAYPTYPRWTVQKQQLIDGQIQQLLRAAETGGVLLRPVLWTQVGVDFGAPAAWSALEHMRVM